MNMVYNVILIRDSTQSVLRTQWTLYVDSIQDEQDQVDDIIANNYPDWQIGAMSITST